MVCVCVCVCVQVLTLTLCCRVDNLYAFFIQWSPDIYGGEDEIDPTERGERRGGKREEAGRGGGWGREEGEGR